MDFTDYQNKAHSMSINTEINGDTRLYPILGLCGETGEVAEKLKKLYRDRDGKVDDQFEEALVKEMGDILWYVAELCTQFNLDMNAVAEMNIEKLFSRKERGKIQGDGDNR